MMGVWVPVIVARPVQRWFDRPVRFGRDSGWRAINPALSLETYLTLYWWIGIAGIGIGVLLLALSPILSKMTHGVK